jgi:hypothetical protein
MDNLQEVMVGKTEKFNIIHSVLLEKRNIVLLQTQYCSDLYYLIQVKCPVLNFVGGILAKVKVNN